MLRFLTAGESHGICLTCIVEGLPGDLNVDVAYINEHLRRRQLGYGRGGRMNIEKDAVKITSGVRHGRTIGSPISFTIENKDWNQWQIPMSVDPVPEGADIRSVELPRPGHADLAGALKLQTYDMRNVLERASARETAARVAGGAFCRLFLAHFGIQIGSHTLAIGRERVAKEYEILDRDSVFSINPESPVRCADLTASSRMIELIDEAAAAGDSLGGITEVVAGPIPPGLGSHIQWDRRLDGQIAQAMISIPAAKAVDIGYGIKCAQENGSLVHDEIFYDSSKKRFYRRTNNAGGIEGGISNGEDIRVKIYIKPIPTLRKALVSVNIRSRRAASAAVERSDTCAVPAAGIVAEGMLALVLANAFLEKFGGDSMKEVERNYAGFLRMLEQY
ncbi:MAG: chorismate synthase [Acidobacteria bacterium]|nr:chorismate synthase [Acidobacteriota bacterium]